MRLIAHSLPLKDSDSYSQTTLTPVEMDIPLHCRMKEPGIKRVTVGELHHKNIVSVIEEKVQAHDKGFHYEPYELFWSPNANCDPVRVHGELYTSDAFLKAHRDL